MGLERGRGATTGVTLPTQSRAVDDVRRAAATLCARQRELADRWARLNRDAQRGNDPLVADFPDQALQRQNDEVIDRLRALTAWEMDRIDSALAQIASGNYGCCERCDQSIDPARLEVMPDASLCERCARSLDPRAASRAMP
jgi:RNA polymerase-binding transcription factor DksA